MLNGLPDVLVLLLVDLFALLELVFDVLTANGLVKENEDNDAEYSCKTKQGNHNCEVLLLIFLFLIVLNLQFCGLANVRAIGFEGGPDFKLKCCVARTCRVVFIELFATNELCCVQSCDGHKCHRNVLLCLVAEHQANDLLGVIDGATVTVKLDEIFGFLEGCGYLLSRLDELVLVVLLVLCGTCWEESLPLSVVFR